MYSSFDITAITDIPTLVNTFAASAGWTVTGSSGSPILTHPTLGGAIPFQLTAAISSFDHTLAWSSSDGSVTSQAVVLSPKLNGVFATPVVSLPTKVHLFGNVTPEPFMAIVIEYGFNFYRHLYFGYLQKFGNFTGGEVVSGAGFGSSAANVYPKSYLAGDAQYLFSARQNQWAANKSGGVNIVHADNATHPWRIFQAPLGANSPLNIPTTAAIGGYKDDANDGYLARGKSSFAGTNILVPMTLYSVRQGGNPPVFAPIGVPAGVRLVHMQDIDPGSSIAIGAVSWRCFAAFRKNNSETVTRVGTGWGADETSSWVGYAYPEG